MGKIGKRIMGYLMWAIVISSPLYLLHISYTYYKYGEMSTVNFNIFALLSTIALIILLFDSITFHRKPSSGFSYKLFMIMGIIAAVELFLGFFENGLSNLVNSIGISPLFFLMITGFFFHPILAAIPNILMLTTSLFILFLAGTAVVRYNYGLGRYDNAGDLFILYLRPRIPEERRNLIAYGIASFFLIFDILGFLFMGNSRWWGLQDYSIFIVVGILISFAFFAVLIKTYLDNGLHCAILLTSSVLTEILVLGDIYRMYGLEGLTVVCAPLIIFTLILAYFIYKRGSSHETVKIDMGWLNGGN